MASIKITLVCLMLGVMASQVVQGRQLRQASALTCQVSMFDDSFSGGSQTWEVDMPNGGTNGCSECIDLNRIRTNSWESFLSSCGSTITLYDPHGCSGTGTPYPARSGVIQGSLSNSVDSFILCA